MRLDDRELRIRMRGTDVARLQGELSILGFTIDNEESENSRFGKSTGQAVRSFQRIQRLNITGTVDRLTAALINVEVDRQEEEGEEEISGVQGEVLHSEGYPWASVLVRAFIRSLRHERSLGEDTTDQDGHYSINYDPDILRVGRRIAAVLIVRVYDARGGVLFCESETRINTEQMQTVNLTAWRNGEEISGVWGHIRGREGILVASTLVRAFAKILLQGQSLPLELSLGENTTDQDGIYSINYDPETLSLIERVAADKTLVVRVYASQGVLLAEEETQINTDGGKQIVNMREETSGVWGQILDREGIPVALTLVRAFATLLQGQSLPLELSLGEDITDQDGHYSINYDSDTLSVIERVAADKTLVVRVYTNQGVLLAEEESQINTDRGKQTVNLIARNLS